MRRERARVAAWTVVVVVWFSAVPAFQADTLHFDTGEKSLTGQGITPTSRGGGGEPATQSPTACIAGGDAITVFEGDLVTFDGTCSSDPDGFIVSYSWDFDLGLDANRDGDPTNDGDAEGGFVPYTWFDDYASEVLLTVRDNDGLTASTTQTVTVLNRAPEGSFEGALVEFTLSIRMAGERWSNVNVDVHRNYDRDTGSSDGVVGSLDVERWPGNPNANPTAGGGSIPIRADATGDDLLTAVITYDPFADDGDLVRGDEPVNGQIWGASPIWLILTFPDGRVCKVNHVFNVRQSLDRDRDVPTHIAEPWIVDLAASAGADAPVTFIARATEDGSDDVTFTWDFGDGTVVSTTHFYDPPHGPDPAFPPGSPYEPYGGGTLPPLSLVDEAVHTYASPGTYTVTLTINDDDGGVVVLTLEMTVVESVLC